MEVELYTINKEAKRLRDDNKLLYEHSAPKSYFSPIYDTLDTVCVPYNKELVGLGLIVEVEFNYYPYYMVSDVVRVICEYVDCNAKDDWGYDEEEIDECIKELKEIEDKNSEYNPHDIIKTNKELINELYEIKQKVLLSLIENKKAKLIGYHKAYLEDVTQVLQIIEYNGFTFHLKGDFEIDIKDVEFIDEVSSENKLNNDMKIDFKKAYESIINYIKGS
jgi:hypothetical protein